MLPPGGGPPDTIPPKIEEAYPLNGSTNFHDDYFELSFSEYVDKRSVKDAIFISPQVEGDLDLSWTGTTVRVYFPAPLKPDVTYNVTIGTDVVDYNNKNRMADAFSLVFSTGNKIDHGMIRGTVYDEKPSGVMIFAYKVSGDTIDPAKRKADYLSQVGTTGAFTVSGLADGEYRVFAVKDEYRDFLFQPDQDMIGIPSHDVFLSSADSIFNGLNFSLTKIDTVGPRLFSAVMTDKHHILTTFSEQVDSSSFNAEKFAVIDSTTKQTIPVRFAFKGRAKEKEMVLALHDTLSEKAEWYLLAKDIKDLSGNTTPHDGISLTVSDRVDTSSPTLMRTIPQEHTADVDFQNTAIAFYFDNEFNVSSLKKKIAFTDTTGNNVRFTMKKLDDASFVLNPEQKLKSLETYIIQFNFKDVVDIAGNSIDSLYRYSFKTFNGLNFTGFSGKVENLDTLKNPLLFLESTKNPSATVTAKPNGKGEFTFSRIEPGKYKLYCVYDTDNNGAYSPGFPYPYKPSEEMMYCKPEINLPPRWEVTDFKWDVKAVDMPVMKPQLPNQENTQEEAPQK